MAGRLAFAASCTFRRLGRAMIKPVYSQQYSRTGAVGSALETALRWWLHVLTMGIAEHKPWKMPEGPVMRIYVDAASTPAHCAAVMMYAGMGTAVQFFRNAVALAIASRRSALHE